MLKQLLIYYYYYYYYIVYVMYLQAISAFLLFLNTIVFSSCIYSVFYNNICVGIKMSIKT